MKTPNVPKLSSLIAIVAAAGLSACAHAPAQPARTNLRCNPEPQYWGYSEQGQVQSEIHVCFASDGSLTYVVQPPQPKPAPAPAAPAPKPAKAKKGARP